MGKIICEVCGTVYPDTADACPICGYSRDMGGFDQGEDLLGENQAPENAYSDDDFKDFDLSQFEDYEYEEPKQPQTPKAAPQAGNAGQRRPIFDYDAVNPQERGSYDSYEDVGNEVTLNDYPEDQYDNYDNYYNEKPPKSHVGLIVFLVILILLLIGATAFMFLKFILPNLNGNAAVMPETVATVPETTAAPTTEPTVPCTSLVLVDGGSVELSKEGQFFLIHASFSPEDTTDVLTYVSQDESIATVDEGGKITAVGEGQTNIILTCGTQTITLPVTVAYQEETVATEAEETAAIEEAAETESTEAAAETEAPAEGETAETEAPTEPPVELKLKKTDLMSGVRGVSFRLELDCDLSPEDVEWTSTDPGVATVANGVVTTVGNGTCKIVAKYGGQEVSCVIRCNF